MYFSVTRLGVGHARHAIRQNFVKYFQIRKLSSRDSRCPVLLRNSLSLCFNCYRQRAPPSLQRRLCHVAVPNSVEAEEVDDDIFPQPVQSLKTLSKLMEDKLSRNPIFTISSSTFTQMNQVELTLNWPETQTFTAEARGKKEALHDVCRQALNWLYANRHISKSARPILTFETTRLNTFHVNLNQSVVNEVDQVLKTYSEDILPALSQFDRTWNCYESDMTHIHPTLGVPHPSSEDLEKWNKTLKKPVQFRSINLPIDKFREEILSAVKSSRVTIVKGATGCGKTTKVPQFVLDEALVEGRGAYCNIAVCLPRRLTAKETARFVAKSRREHVGRTIGFNVRMDRTHPSVPGGSITFMTGQKLALKFTGNQSLRGVSHVIMDEVHLRDVGTDLLMSLVRQALELNKDLKVIIMSATINSDIFQTYFSQYGPIPVIEVPGRTYPVKVNYLDDLPSELISGKSSPNINNLEIDYGLVRRVILWIHHTKPTGAILVFVSGWSDIVELTKLLSDETLQIIPVHRKLKDHSAALKPAQKGSRKVLLATNVAETSITFPDVVYVIDCGIQKCSQRRLLSRGRWSSEDLTSKWVSKANVIQRRGRAGRVRPGESYHLFTEETFQQMAEYEVPQIMNSSLEPVVMMAKMVNPKMGAVELLGAFPQPPPHKDIDETVSTLKELSLLSYSEEKPTALAVAAMKMSAPLPSAIAMIQSAVFRCVDTMVSVLSSDEETPFQMGAANEERRIKSSLHASSDHLAKAYHANTVYPVPQRTRNLNFFYKGMVRRQSDFFKNIDLNVYDSEMLVKCILLSSFGSLLVRVETPLNRFTVDSSGVSALITPRSVNNNFADMDFPFALYLSRHGKDRLLFVDDTSSLSPLSVLLFLPTDFRTEEIDSENIRVRGWRNNYVSLVMSKEDYARVQDLRRALKDILDYFIITEILNYPDENYTVLSQFRSDLINCLNNMLSAELVQETDL